VGTDDRETIGTINPKHEGIVMPQKKETTRTTKKKTGAKVHDLAPKKDAKAGVGKSFSSAPRPDGARFNG